MKNIIRKIGIVFTIGTTCLIAFAGYCDTNFKANETAKDLDKLEVSVDKTFDKIEAKMDEFIREQTGIQVQNAEIYAIVKYLKKKAD